jgi:hypothetical protein
MTFAKFVGSGTTGVFGVLSTIVIPFIGSLAFFIFVWGVLKYFFFNNHGDSKQLEEGRAFVLWGLLGLVVLFSVWGFLNIVLSTLGIMPSS